MYILTIYTRGNSSWYTRLLNNSTQQVFGGSYEDVMLTKVLKHSTEEPLKYSKLLARSKDIPEIAELYKEVYGI